MSCVVSNNQPLYQALIDKATSYPPDKPYQAMAYRKAAESIAASDRNLYSNGYIDFEKIPYIGYKIKSFINEFLDNLPYSTVPDTPNTLFNPYNSIDKKYYPSSDELQQVRQVFINYCAEKNILFTEDIITTFYKSIPYLEQHRVVTKYWKDGIIGPLYYTIPEIARNWARYHCPIIMNRITTRGAKTVIV